MGIRQARIRSAHGRGALMAARRCTPHGLSSGRTPPRRLPAVLKAVELKPPIWAVRLTVNTVDLPELNEFNDWEASVKHDLEGTERLWPGRVERHELVFAYVVLRDAGIETSESCQGGDGHDDWEDPWVDVFAPRFA